MSKEIGIALGACERLKKDAALYRVELKEIENKMTSLGESDEDMYKRKKMREEVAEMIAIIKDVDNRFATYFKTLKDAVADYADDSTVSGTTTYTKAQDFLKNYKNP